MKTIRKVLVTGGSRGIGAAIVKRFRENGDSVLFTWKSDETSAAATAETTGAKGMRADASDPVSTDKAIGELGGVDVLVCCAGISQIKLFCDLTDEDWNTMTETNLSGVFYACRSAARKMVGNKSGRIIIIGSMWGERGASCEVHYSAAKAGLRGLTKALAKELGPSGITVNCVEPGCIDTLMNKELDEKTKSELIESTPLCRIGTPVDVAGAVFFLASDDASFITGQCLGVDGGIIA